MESYIYKTQYIDYYKISGASCSCSPSFHYMKEPTNKAMNSSAITIFSKRWQKLPWFLMFFFLSSTTFTLNSASSSATTLPSYKDHCASTIPEPQHSSQKARLGSFPLSRSHDGYYSGGNPFLNPKLDRYGYYSGAAFSNSVSFRTMAVYAATDDQNLFKVEGSLTFQGVNTYNRVEDSYSGVVYSSQGDRRNSVTFSLSGFRSESSGDLCMVGSGSAYSKEGNQLNLGAVLKLHNLTKNANITSLITGTLESLSSADASDHFEAISILMLPPQMSYKYTDSTDFSNGDSVGGRDIPSGMSLGSLPEKSFCSIAYSAVNQFNLKYSKGCNISTKNCSTPFQHAGIEYVPRVVSLYAIQCSDVDEKLRVLMEFPDGSHVSYYRSFNPNTTLVGEGSWDENNNQLFIVACRFLGMTESLANAHVGDCSAKLIFWFPPIWSISDSSNILGQIWSNKTVKEHGYFDMIKLQSSRNRMVGVPDQLKYEYTKIDTAKKLCSDSDTKTIKGKGYPDAFSSNMRFDISIKHSKREVGWGYAEPLFVGDRFYDYQYTGSEVAANVSNISYRIGLTPSGVGGGISLLNSSSYDRSLVILAEGIYDSETGSLCMVGCRNLGSDNQIPIDDDTNKDCEILVKFQFPPLKSKNSGKIKGSITSTRNKTHYPYFETVDLSSYAFYGDQASIWRMDMEIIMVLISTTLSCVLVVLQLFHVKRHLDVLPFISLVTLSVLTLGNMIPLLLNFEALFFENRGWRYEWFQRGGLLEVNEVIVRVTGMIAFLLQFRLLQQTWSARVGDGNQKVLWIAEKKATFVVLPLYVAGALLALLIANWKEPQPDQYGMISSGSMDYTQRSQWKGLKSYAGLVLDGFLLPQILLNMFRNSKENALSIPFYIGTTFVRVLPHAYDLYRAHMYAHQYDGSSYIYANRAADYYSTAWDVVIPLGGLLFAVIIYLQQRFGGRCILPRKYRELEVYEKVPVVSDA